ncbi:MAG: hypothetical protein B5M56_07415 [Desulfococcus sp. 4484_241]|nr:MAG: hypothetical protein B5M56_07415 [Desulfococcus sp. 4484_241]
MFFFIALPCFGYDAQHQDCRSLEACRGQNRPLPAPVPVVNLFKKYISPLDGERCSMFPTCSTYSIQAFKKHGLFWGWIMTCDRLLRCGRDEWDNAPHVIVDGRLRCYDPVENNDFWWTK